MVEQIGKPVKHSVGYEQSNDQKRYELDHRFGGNGEDQTVLMFCGINFAGSKSYCKYGQYDGCTECQIGDVRLCRLVEGADDGQQRRGNRFKLQRHIGNNADESDNGHQCSHHLRFAISGGDKIRC